MNTAIKSCSTCGETKPLTEFYVKRPSGRNKAGHQQCCKQCSLKAYKEYTSLRRANDPVYAERRRAYGREWQKNPANVHRVRLRRYRLTEAAYDEMLVAQNGACAICGNNQDLQIDHDHACCPKESGSCGECIRGLLCKHCNVGLSRFSDDPEILMAAARYLAKWKTSE